MKLELFLFVEVRLVQPVHCSFDEILVLGSKGKIIRITRGNTPYRYTYIYISLSLSIYIFILI